MSSGEEGVSAVPLHFHALLSGVLPPFSSFLDEVLSDYQIHALHLDPCSLILLSALVFLCEAFVGVNPSMALLCHFFSLELVYEMQCPGCASLKIDDASALGIPCVELLPEVVGFQRQWVQVELQEEIDRRVGDARHSLLLDYHVKLRLQESRFFKCHDCLQNEASALWRRLDQEMENQQAALDAQAIPEGKLSNICKQVRGASSLVGEASKEAARARSLQVERSRMFQSLERSTSHALGDICGESISGPLIPNDSEYLGFFYRIMERLEASAEKAFALAEEKSRDLLGQAASDIFSHLLRLNPDFDFTSVPDPVPETFRAALAEWVEVHVQDLVARLTLDGRDMGSDEEVPS
ncbi:hypothetical protein D1007_54169 [Hordeum vulgare]|nr:hypothetical protein D1007_54169 [Hordeum vulgare]